MPCSCAASLLTSIFLKSGPVVRRYCSFYVYSIVADYFSFKITNYFVQTLTISLVVMSLLYTFCLLLTWLGFATYDSGDNYYRNYYDENSIVHTGRPTIIIFLQNVITFCKMMIIVGLPVCSYLRKLWVSDIIATLAKYRNHRNTACSSCCWHAFCDEIRWISALISISATRELSR